MFPIGLGYLATQLHNHGYNAKIYNADFGIEEYRGLGRRDILSRTKKQSDYVKNVRNDRHHIWQEISETIDNFEPDMVGVYTATLALPVALKIIDIVKQKNSGCYTIMGGPHITVRPEDAMIRTNLDFTLMGEADYTILQLCDALKSGSYAYKQIRGLGYRENGRVIVNREYDFIDDIDSLPIVNRGLVLNRGEYPDKEIGRLMVGSRGCPYDCTFCASPAIWKRRVRYHSPERLVSEIKYLKKEFCIREFAFDDDTFTSVKKHTFRFCELLMQEDLGCTWSCLTRADAVDDELLETMKRAGCVSVQIGVESGSDKVLKMMNKKITTDQVRRAACLIHKHKLRFQTFFMVGTPYETEDDIKKTIVFIKEINAEKVHLCTFTPNPGTEAHRHAVEAGMMPVDFDWAKNVDISHHSFSNHFTPYVSADTFRKLVYEAIEAAKISSRTKVSTLLRAYWHRRSFYMKNPGYVKSKITTRFRKGFNTG